MNATGLPIPTSSPPAPAAPAAAAPANNAPAADDDFLQMLAQFLGGAVTPTPAPTTGAGGKALLDKDTDSTDADDAALAAMLPFATVAPPVPLQPAVTAAGKGDGVLDIKALALDGVSAKASADLLAATTDKPIEDNLTTSSNANPASAALVDGSQNSRTPAVIDASNARPMHNPVGTNAWADELGTRLTVMAERGQHSASLRLSPEHLGPLEVRIAVRDDQASVWFGAAHADTRAAIEQALPRLRELFASQGLSLTDAGVFREPPRDQPKLPQAFGSQAGGDAGDGAQVISIRHVRLGLVDAYA